MEPDKKGLGKNNLPAKKPSTSQKPSTTNKASVSNNKAASAAKSEESFKTSPAAKAAALSGKLAFAEQDGAILPDPHERAAGSSFDEPGGAPASGAAIERGIPAESARDDKNCGQKQPDADDVIIDVKAAFDRNEAKTPSFTRNEIMAAWWKAARPPFYIATLVPLFLGYFAARNDVGPPSPLVFSGVLLVGFLLHLAANLANDLYDYLLGTDTEDTIGGSRGLQDGTISVPQLRLALFGCYGLTAFFTLLGVWITGLWGLAFIALFGALASYYYVAPPVMYGYRAMGELFVFMSMGLVMTCGSYYALAGKFAPHVMALSIPVGLMVAGILYYQSLPEIETDAAMGKKTLVGVLGAEKAVFLFKLWWPVVWLLIISLYLSGIMAWPALLGVAAGIPLHIKACKKVNGAGGDWVSLDQYGKYVRIMYMLAGIFMLAGVGTL